jgi:hypothetical protein
MGRDVLLQITFICGDHRALLRGLVDRGLVASSPPDELAAHDAKVKPVPADWAAVDFRRKTLKADWADGSYVLVNRGDLVRISTRKYPLDVPELVSRLARCDFEAASVRQIVWWDNPKGPAYKPPEGTIGTAPLGFAVAFRGDGHRRAMSRRWLDRGPWRVLRGDHDTTFVQFHDENADVSTSLAQAKPGHALMSDRDQAPLPLRDAYQPGVPALEGTYLADQRRLMIAVAGRSPSRRELRDAVAARFYQLLGADRPLDNVQFRFAYQQELDAVLPDLWLYGLEAYLRDGSGLHRKDDGYAPPPYAKPAWVKALGRDDRVER